MEQVKMRMGRRVRIKMSDEEDDSEEKPNIKTSELPDEGGVQAELGDGEEEQKEDPE